MMGQAISIADASCQKTGDRGLEFILHYRTDYDGWAFVREKHPESFLVFYLEFVRTINNLI